MKDNHLFLEFQQNAAFKGLSIEDVRSLFEAGSEVIIQPNEYLMKEGEPAKNVFFLLEGTFEISKKDSKSESDFVIATLGPKDLVGEVGLFDNGPRSASVRALTEAKLISIPFSVIHELAEKNKTIWKIFFQISQNVASRLRNTSNQAVAALESQLAEFKNRVILSNLFVLIVVLICSFSFALSGLSLLTAMGVDSTIITLPITLILVYVIYHFMRKFKFPPRELGLTLDGWRKAVFEGVVFTSILLVLIVLLKWIYIQWFPQPLFKLEFPVIPIIIYCLFVAPLQEFAARGGIQSVLMKFLTGENPRWKAIIVADILFSTFHLFMSLKVGVIVFIPGLFFGWIFSRNLSLIAPWIAHALVGTFGFFVIGLI